MTFKVRKIPDEVVFALVAAHNQKQLDSISTNFHLSQSEDTEKPDYRSPSVTRLRVTHADATNATTQLTMTNHLKTVLNQHIVDPHPVHNTAVSAALATATATDATSANTLANAIKAAYNTHLDAADVHFTNDSTNDVSAADATNATSLQTLVNEIKTKVNAHLASAPSGTYIDLKPA